VMTINRAAQALLDCGNGPDLHLPQPIRDYLANEAHGYRQIVVAHRHLGGFCRSPQKGASGFFRRRHDRALG